MTDENIRRKVKWDKGISWGEVIFRRRLCTGWYLTERIIDIGKDKFNCCFEDLKAVRGLKGIGLDMIIDVK